MSSKTTFEMPIPVGRTAYMVSKTGFVFKNTVLRYIVSGDNPHENRICLGYADGHGGLGKRNVALNLFGRTVFATEPEAIRAAQRMGRRFAADEDGNDAGID